MSLQHLVVAFIVLFAGILILVMGQPNHSMEISQWLLVWTLVMTGPFFIGMSTAPDGLPDDCAESAPVRHRWHAPLLTAGGGRGLLLLLVSLAWLFGCHLFGRFLDVRQAPVLPDVDTAQLAMVCMYSWIYVALPSTLFAARERTRFRTGSLRVTLVASVMLSWILSSLIFSFGMETVGMALFPFEMVEMFTSNGRISEQTQPAFQLLCVVAALSLLLATPRMLRGVREVRRRDH